MQRLDGGFLSEFDGFKVVTSAEWLNRLDLLKSSKHLNFDETASVVEVVCDE